MPKKTIEEDYPIGAKVRLSTEAERMFPRRKGGIGKVCGHSRDGLPKVSWNNRKLVDKWHPSLLHRLPTP